MVALLLAALIGQDPAPASEPRRHSNVAYAGPDSTPAQSLDIYAPEGAVDRPVVMWIHGGGWRRGDKAQVQLKPRAFAEQGYLLVSVNYRLQPETEFRGQAGDLARAVSWVRAHAREYGGSPDEIFLLGHSAGAHLAALVATDASYLESVDLDLAALRGVVLLDGAGYDIPVQYRFGGPRVKQLYGSAFGDDEASQREASPLTHVGAGKHTPPFLILYVADRRDSRRQSRLLADALRAAGVDAHAVPAEGKTHMTINRDLGQPDDAPTRDVFEFLQRNQRSREPQDAEGAAPRGS